MKNKNYKYFINNGFTLLEMIFAIGLFSLVITVVIGVFVKSSQIQRKVIELNTVQREGSYMMEMMSREIRTATAISDGNDGNEDQQGNSNSSVEFTNYNGDLVKYCRANATGVCTENDSGKYLSCNGQIINSSSVEIESLRFYVSDDFDVNQPMVTISMKVKPTIGQFNTEISLQNSVTLRVY